MPILLKPQRANASPPLDECVDTDTAARILGVSAAALEKWRARGNSPLRFVRVGRLVKYRLSEIERYLDAAARSSTSDAGRGT